MKLIDFGCYTQKARDKYKPDEYIGVDISYTNPETRKKEGQEDYIVDFNKPFTLPFKNKYFDVVLVQNIFEHLFNIFPLVDESNRLAKDKIIITVPNCMSYYNRLSMLTGNSPVHPKHWELGGHHLYFDIYHLIGFVAHFFPKFDIVQINYYCTGKWATAIKPIMNLNPLLFATEIEFELVRK
jgi:hypothetical protein